MIGGQNWGFSIPPSVLHPLPGEWQAAQSILSWVKLEIDWSNYYTQHLPSQHNAQILVSHFLDHDHVVRLDSAHCKMLCKLDCNHLCNQTVQLLLPHLRVAFLKFWLLESYPAWLNKWLISTIMFHVSGVVTCWTVSSAIWVQIYLFMLKLFNPLLPKCAVSYR